MMFLSKLFLKPSALGLCLLVVSHAGCGQDMADQPHVKPLEASDFFADGQSARPLVPGTVARGHLRTDAAFYEGKLDDQLVDEFPWQKVAEKLKYKGSEETVRLNVLRRGRERFDIFCAACHDRTGSGQGMVVRRGFPAPPSYHTDRLRKAPAGHFFDVATHGFGRMPDYAEQIPTADRWAIVAYVKALQFSQHANARNLSAADRKELSTGGSTP